MGDFVQKSVTRSAARVLATPIEDAATFNTIVAGVISDNPFGCTAYQYGEESMPAVEKTKERYTAKIAYQDLEAKTVGLVTAQSPSLAAYNANVTAILADAAVATAMGGTAVHALEDDTFSATLKCHAASGEIFTLTFSRTALTLASYEDDAIRTTVEAWADTVPALA